MIINPEFINTVQRWPDSVIISEWSALNVRSKVHLYLDDYATLIYCERVRRGLDTKWKA